VQCIKKYNDCHRLSINIPNTLILALTYALVKEIDANFL